MRGNPEGQIQISVGKGDPRSRIRMPAPFCLIWQFHEGIPVLRPLIQTNLSQSFLIPQIFGVDLLVDHKKGEDAKNISSNDYLLKI